MHARTHAHTHTHTHTYAHTHTRKQVVRDTLQLARVQQYSRVQLDEWVEHDRRQRMHGEKNNRRQLADNTRRREVCSAGLSPLMDLTEEDAEILRESEEEFGRRGGFRLVFPCNDALTREASKLFQTRRFHNLLLLHWVTRGNWLTVDDYLNGKHLASKNPDPGFKQPSVSANAVVTAAASKDAERQKKDGVGTAGSPLASRRSQVAGCAAAGDRVSEWSGSNSRPASHLHSKLSATQAERSGLLAESARWHRAPQTNEALSSPIKQQQALQTVQVQQLQQHSTNVLLQAQQGGSFCGGWDQVVVQGGSKRMARLPCIERPRSSPLRQPARAGSAGFLTNRGTANAREQLVSDGQACAQGNPEHGEDAPTVAFATRSLSALRPATAACVVASRAVADAEEGSEATGSSSRCANVFDMGTFIADTQLPGDEVDEMLFADVPNRQDAAVLADGLDGAVGGDEECAAQHAAAPRAGGAVQEAPRAGGIVQESSSGDEDSSGSFRRKKTDGPGVQGGARRDASPLLSPTSPSSSRSGWAAGGRTHQARIRVQNPLTAGAGRTQSNLASAPDTCLSPLSPKGAPLGGSDGASGSGEVGAETLRVPNLPAGARGAGGAHDEACASACTQASPREDGTGACSALFATPPGPVCASPSSPSSLSSKSWRTYTHVARTHVACIHAAHCSESTRCPGVQKPALPACKSANVPACVCKCARVCLPVQCCVYRQQEHAC